MKIPTAICCGRDSNSRQQKVCWFKLKWTQETALRLIVTTQSSTSSSYMILLQQWHGNMRGIFKTPLIQIRTLQNCIGIILAKIVLIMRTNFFPLRFFLPTDLSLGRPGKKRECDLCALSTFRVKLKDCCGLVSVLERYLEYNEWSQLKSRVMRPNGFVVAPSRAFDVRVTRPARSVF